MIVHSYCVCHEPESSDQVEMNETWIIHGRKSETKNGACDSSNVGQEMYLELYGTMEKKEEKVVQSAQVPHKPKSFLLQTSTNVEIISKK